MTITQIICGVIGAIIGYNIGDWLQTEYYIVSLYLSNSADMIGLTVFGVIGMMIGKEI